VVFSPDGKTLALAGKRNAPGGAALTLWDAKSGRELLSCQKQGYAVVRPIAFSPDGKRLFGQASQGLHSGGVRVWDARTGEEVLSIKGAGFLSGVGPVLALSPDGKRPAGYGADKTLKVWDAESGKELLTLKGGRFQSVTTIVFSPDGSRVVSASSETATVQVWNSQTGEELLTLKGQGPLAFSPDGHRLFGRAADGTLKTWDATPLPEKP
jgi:Tol biopolymer transport system component